MKRLIILIALAAGFNSISTSAHIDPRNVAVGVVGTLAALKGLDLLTSSSLICDSDQSDTTSEMVVNQINRVIEKAGALGLFVGGTATATQACRGENICGPNRNPTIIGSIIGGITMVTGLRLLTQGQTKPKDTRKSLALRQTNLVLSKLGALALMIAGGFIISEC